MEEKANIVRTSIRMDAELHRKLADYVHDRRFGPERTSIDAVVQDAVRNFLSGGSAHAPSQPTGEFIKCPQHLVRIIHRIINDLSNPAEYEAHRREGEAAAAKQRGHGLKKVR